jgi:hypothetical protein
MLTALHESLVDSLLYRDLILIDFVVHRFDDSLRLWMDYGNSFSGTELATTKSGTELDADSIAVDEKYDLCKELDCSL